MKRLLLAIALVATTAAAQETESITVNARVVDAYGNAVTNLTPADFTATIGGKPAQVEKAEWNGPRAKSGRSMVFVIDSRFAWNDIWFSGLHTELVDQLAPNDRVAVFSLDSHLKLRADFTNDRNAILAAFIDSIGLEGLPLGGSSFGTVLDDEAMRGALTSEAATMLLADVVRRLPDETMVIPVKPGAGPLLKGLLAGYYELVLRGVVQDGENALSVRANRRGLRVHVSAEFVVPNVRVNGAEKYLEAVRRLQDGETEGVEALLDAAIAADPRLPEPWFHRGMLAAERGDMDAAERDLKRYLELAPRGKYAVDAREMLRQ